MPKPQITIAQPDLKALLARVCRAIDPKNPVAVLQRVVLGAADGILTATGGDHTLQVRATCGCEGELAPTAFDPELLQKTVAALSGDVTIAHEKAGVVRVAAQGYKGRLHVLDGRVYPPMPEVDGMRVVVDKAELIDNLTQVAAFAAKDQLRPVLSSVCAVIRGGHVDLCAVDNYRGGSRRAPHLGAMDDGATEPVITVPLRAVREVLALLNACGAGGTVDLLLSDSRVVTAGNDVYLSAALLADPYPINVVRRMFRGESETQAIVDRAAFLAALAPLMPLAEQGTVEVLIDDGMVNLRAETGEVGSAEASVEADITGPPALFYLSARYLADAMETLRPAARVILGAQPEPAPVVFCDAADPSRVNAVLPRLK